MSWGCRQRITCALFGLLLSIEARGGPVVIWATPELPAASVQARADRETGGSEHLTSLDLMFPPGPGVQSAARALAALDEAVAAGRQRWSDFEVELPIARDLALTLEDVPMLPDKASAEHIMEALLFQGAAALRAFDAEDFPTAADAAPFRVVVDGQTVCAPWVTAMALSDRIGRDITPADHVDGAARADFVRHRELLDALPRSILRLPMGGDAVWVDGVEVPPGVSELELRPGQHWVHVVRDGVISGVSTVWLEAGREQGFPTAVSPEELESFSQRVARGLSDELPDVVDDVVERLATHHGGDVFLGAMVGRRLRLTPWSLGASLEQERRVTVVIAGEVGGGIVLSPIFEEPGSMLAGAAHGGLSLEVGVTHFAVAMGLDAGVTPGRTVAHADQAETTNRYTSVALQPWLGLGVYALRPVAARPTLMLLAHTAWHGPAHLVVGGRLAAGVPLDDRNNWFRISAGVAYGPDTLWDLPGEPVTLWSGFFRIGVASRL